MSNNVPLGPNFKFEINWVKEQYTKLKHKSGLFTVDEMMALTLVELSIKEIDRLTEEVEQYKRAAQIQANLIDKHCKDTAKALKTLSDLKPQSDSSQYEIKGV